jgi:EAL and modified HD-GYP domain-containing signal transduction protein
MQYLRILEHVNRKEIDINRICQLISEDVSLTCKLLAFINSAAFRIRDTVHSIKQAVVLLGEHGIRRWITLAVLVGMALDSPGELVVNSLVRARFSESMAKLLGAPQRSDEFYLMGMLSRVDAMVGLPLAQVLANIHLSPDVNSALLGVGKGMPQRVLEMLSLYERAEWELLRLSMAAECIQQTEMTAAYRDALAWADHIFAATINHSAV